MRLPSSSSSLSMTIADILVYEMVDQMRILAPTCLEVKACR
jgi:hypothetical protein